ncbi:MAG: beta-galactosidase trimerization domain-containing protein, partial [Deltaproteobacteria bacterium]|nr:beta-galactosidase trimerization domain-containing protein [Deltaproteobacteria bacterium]
RVAAQAAEILDAYPADGLFFDILMQPQPACCCPRCIEQMRARGLDPKDARSAAAFSHEVMREAHARLARALRGRRAGLSFFANSCFTLAGRDLVPYDSHVEVESLPTGGWGYAHLPIMGRFARTLGKPFSGMTARFHQTWGDVGGLKPQAALEQECFHALMLGGACCIGDHLPPGGRPEPAVYERIGAVFAQVQARAPWCRGARPVTQVGLLVPPVHEIPPAAAGAARMLAEAHLLFDVVSPQARLESYEALVLPDEIRLDAELAARLEAYLAQGGKVLATAESGLAESEARFALGAWPVTFSGQARFSRQYLLPGKELRRHIPDMPHALYCSGLEVRARRGAEVLATLGDPYFSRSAERFSGHTEVAMARRTRRPAIVRQGPVVYIQSPLFTAYALTAYPVYRQIVARMLDGLLGSRAVEAALPTTARLSLLQRGRRRIVHLMSYVPERRAAGLDIIEESQPLYHVRLRVRVSRRPGRVYLAPGEVELEHGYGEGFVELSVPEVDGHVMVVLEPARRSRA